ncbi:MAG TPA: SPOR domain-containing protein, partial [Alphaproteobacteria bacterium]|nr:SPOR domain-containing protein [Alphaproteobacteria bacterium]
VSSELVGETNIYIQAGAFANFSNANLLSARLHQFGRWRVTSVIIGGRELYRVRFGPLETVEDADLLLAQVIESGHTDARIIVD